VSRVLKNSREFGHVYRSGKSYANKYLVMYVLNNELSSNRIGISASKKIGNSVVRHRITRLIRESYRLNESMFNSGLDIVIVARPGSKDRCYSEISSAFMHLSKLQRILNDSK
jgi:ribonuclease P protein component